MKELWRRLRETRRKTTSNVVLAFNIPDGEAFDDWLVSDAPWSAAPVIWRTP